MSNVGGNKARTGVVTGVIVAQAKVGNETAEFEPEGFFEDAVGFVSGAQRVVTGAVSGVQQAASGAISNAISGGQNAVQQVVRTVQNAPGANTYLGTTPVRPAVTVPSISIPKIEIPKLPTIPIPTFSMPKVDIPTAKIVIPDVGKSLFDVGSAVGATIAGTAAGAASLLKSFQVPAVQVPQVDVFKAATDVFTNVTAPVTFASKIGGDLLKGLPDLSNVQKATQSLESAVKLIGMVSPITAPLVIAGSITDYAKDLLTVKPAGSVTSGATLGSGDAIGSTFDSRMALNKAQQAQRTGVINGCTVDKVCDPDRETYGEDHSLAECTIRRGTDVGFIKRYANTDSYPDACLYPYEVKFYVPLGNYKQQEMHGIPDYHANGRIEFIDPVDGEIIFDANQELLASGAMSISKPETSLVYQVWSPEPAVGVAGKDYNLANANRFNITEFRDADSAELEKQVNNLNKQAPAADSYLSVAFSRLGAEAYNGKVLPLDGRKLDPSFTEVVPAELNIEEIYTDLGQQEMGAKVAPGMVTASNLKADAGVKGLVTGSVESEDCGFWDIGCKIGKIVSPTVKTAAKSSGVAGQVTLLAAEGVIGGIPSLADLAYNVTTGALEKVRGLDEGTLVRADSRAAWDTMFGKATMSTLGVDVDEKAITNALGLKYTEGESFETGATRSAVGLAEDALYDPASWFVPGVMEASLLLSAPEIGKGIGAAVSGVPAKETKYQYMFNKAGTTPVTGVETGETTRVIERTVYTTNPVLIGRTIDSDVPMTG